MAEPLMRMMRNRIPHSFIPTYTAGAVRWTLFAAHGREAGSVLTSPDATREQAWAKFEAEKRWQASFRAAVESGEPETLQSVVERLDPKRS